MGFQHFLSLEPTKNGFWCYPYKATQIQQKSFQTYEISGLQTPYKTLRNLQNRLMLLSTMKYHVSNCIWYFRTRFSSRILLHSWYRISTDKIPKYTVTEQNQVLGQQRRQNGQGSFKWIHQSLQQFVPTLPRIPHTLYTGCHRRNGPNFGRVFLMLNYTDITQNTYVPSWTVIEIMAK